MIFLIALFYSFSIHAGEISLKVDHYFNSDESKIVSKAQILNIKGDSISSIKTKGKVNFDFSGYYVLPGLIDAHNHLFVVDKSFGQDFAGEIAKDYNLNREIRIARARVVSASLMNEGITTVRDLGNSGKYLDAEMKNDKNFIRIYGTGPGIATGKGQFINADIKIVEQEYSIINSNDEASAIIKLHADLKVDAIKLYADNDPGAGKMSREMICKLTTLAHELNLKVSVHVSSVESAKNVIDCSADSIEHGYFLPDEYLNLMVKKNIFLVPTDVSSKLHEGFLVKSMEKNITISQWPTQFYKKTMSSRLKRASELNVPLAFGSDMYIDSMALNLSAGKAVKETLYAYAEDGLKNEKILSMATKGSADLLGDKKLGKLTEGSYADIIVLKKNPVEDIHALDEIVFVMSKGRIVLNKLGAK
jgi:imidazolonepropionase-like amidohydrolase